VGAIAASEPGHGASAQKRRWAAGKAALLGSAGTIGFLVVLTLLAPLAGRYEPTLTVDSQLLGPSWAHFFGTDELGRDIWSRVLYGLRTSVEIAALTALIAGLVGTAAGLYSGYFRGWRDSVIMRITDFLLGFPALVAAMIVVAIFGASKTTPIAAAIFVTIPLFARVVRGSVLAERSKEYVIAAQALGASPGRILLRTLLPAVLPVVLVQAAIAGALAVQLEAGLSFLGIGVPPPNPSLGSMLFSAKGFLYNAPLYGVFPGVALTLLVGALVVLSNALEARESVDVTELELRAAAE
jgi:peptide/nickel transport system permease protein